MEIRNYEDWHVEHEGDVSLALRTFTCRIDAGLVAGVNLTVQFVIDRPIADVWPHARDWNLWQNESGFYYSGVLGDMEGQTFSLSLQPNDTEAPHFYRVERVIPDYLLVFSQPVLDDEQVQQYGLPGYGGFSAGNTVFMLADFGGTTSIMAQMEHGSVMAKPGQPMTEDEALESWRSEDNLGALYRWRDGFIPALKKLVDEG